MGCETQFQALDRDGDVFGRDSERQVVIIRSGLALMRGAHKLIGE